MQTHGEGVRRRGDRAGWHGVRLVRVRVGVRARVRARVKVRVRARVRVRVRARVRARGRVLAWAPLPLARVGRRFLPPLLPRSLSPGLLAPWLGLGLEVRVRD